MLKFLLFWKSWFKVYIKLHKFLHLVLPLFLWLNIFTGPIILFKYSCKVVEIWFKCCFFD